MSQSKPKPVIKKVKWYGFDHKKVAKRFEGQLTFCNEFCVKGEYHPVAVYKAKSPDIKKGHKKYVLLQKQDEQLLIRGMSSKEMAKERHQKAIVCLSCNTLLYSINRHHYHGCECSNDTTVDGGKDYLKYSGKNLNLIESVMFDLITNRIKE